MKSSIIHFFGNILKAFLPEDKVVELREGKLKKFIMRSYISHENPVTKSFRKTFTNKKPPIFHIDIHLTDHCNLNCKGCEHYSSLITEPWFAQIDAFSSDLRRLSNLFSEIEQICLLGGEPLLHPELNSFIIAAREILPETRIYVMSNGVLVTRMDDSFWQTMHEQKAILLCDDYPINIDRAGIDALGLKHDVVIEWVPRISEFYRVPVDVTASQNPKESFRRCRGTSNCATLRGGKLYQCARVAYSDTLVEAFPEKNLESLLPGDQDSIDIHTAPDGDSVLDVLMSPSPWCARCAYDNYSTFEWGKTERDPKEWLLTDEERESHKARR